MSENGQQGGPERGRERGRLERFISCSSSGCMRMD